MANIKSEEAYIIGASQKRFREEYHKKRRLKKIKQTFLWILSIIIIAVILFNAGFIVSEYHGTGMSEVASDGDIMITNRLSFLLNNPTRGEVVTIKSTGSDGYNSYLCKRIVGLPGDSVDFENGEVYINGARCIESYINETTASEISHLIVPDGSYYVLNDDRSDTNDSRTIDISGSSIMGSKIAVIHIPDVVQNNDIYKQVRSFFVNSAHKIQDITG